MQVKSIAKCSQGAFYNTFDLHLAPICLNDPCVYLLSGRFWQHIKAHLKSFNPLYTNVFL